MKKIAWAFLAAATCVAIAASFSACSAGIIADVKQEVEEAKLTGAPNVASFRLQSSADAATYSNAQSVTFSISVSGSARAYLVRIGAEAPSASQAAEENQCSGWIAIAAGVTLDSTFTLPNADATYTLSAWAKSDSGQISATAISKTVTLDRVAPTVAIALTSPSPTTDPTVSISLTGDDGVGAGIAAWLVKEGPASPTPSTPSSGDSAWTATKPEAFGLSSGTGTKYIYAWARDRAGNVGVVGSPASVGYFAAPVASLGSEQSTEVSAHERIVIAFDQSMNTGSVSIPSGSFASLWSAGNVSTEWASYGGNADAQLTIAPMSSSYSLWPSGSVTLNLAGSSADGIDLGSTSFALTVNNRVYVHSNKTGSADVVYGGTMSDASAGTKTKPMATLQAAVDFAKTRYDAPTASVTVCAAGNGSGYPYASNYYSTGKAALTMAEGVSVLGGYSPSSWDTRDPDTYITYIADTSSNYGSEFNRAVTIGDATNAGITRATVLDGCTIQGSLPSSGTNPKSAGILCGNDASPTINNCTVIGASGTAATGSWSFGICLQGSGAPAITGCEIRGGSGLKSYGIYISPSAAPSSTIGIHYCTIYGGVGSTYRYGIAVPEVPASGTTNLLVIGSLISAAENSDGAEEAYAVKLSVTSGRDLSSQFFNNVIIGGKGDKNSSNGSLETGMGVYCSFTAPVLVNNTICSGDDARTEGTRSVWPTCVYISSSTGPIMINNYLFSTSTSSYGCGVYEADAASSRPAIFKNNAISVNTDGGVSLIYKAYGSNWYSAPTTPSGPLWDASLIANVNNLNDGTHTFSGNIALYRPHADNAINAVTGEQGASASWPSEVEGGGLTVTSYTDFPTSGSSYLDKTKSVRTSPWTIGAFEY